MVQEESVADSNELWLAEEQSSSPAMGLGGKSECICETRKPFLGSFRNIWEAEAGKSQTSCYTYLINN